MKELTVNEDLKSRIHSIRGVQVMFDSDLAQLYGVLTGNLNKAVKRNIERFPEDFMFQLTKEEFENLMFQFGISSWGGMRKLPYVFTEQGIATLSGILKSKRSIEINVQIMRTFVAMRHFLSKNAGLFQRVEAVEVKQLEHDKNFEKVFAAIEGDLEPKQGIFFDGQIFDAYKFIADLIRSAYKSIVLIDPYVDESTLFLFGKRRDKVAVTIYTMVTPQLQLDVEKFVSQYGSISVESFSKSHDRFLVIDGVVYHIGASLKDAGKKWFAFSRFDRNVLPLLEGLTQAA